MSNLKYYYRGDSYFDSRLRRNLYYKERLWSKTRGKNLGFRVVKLTKV